MNRILLADDHKIILDGIRELLKEEKDLSVVGTVNNGVEVIEFLESNAVDVLILDINMPLMDGLVCTKNVRTSFPKVKVIVLTMYNQRRFVTELVKLGAHGCVLKSSSSEDLVKAIRRVLTGKSYFDMLVDFEDHESKMKPYNLSRRELDIITGICDGLTSKEISDRLFISTHTVRTHRKNIFKKADVHDSASLVRFAMDKGIA